jgi:hypothetical protein
MPTNKEAAVLLQQSVKRLQKYTVEVRQFGRCGRIGDCSKKIKLLNILTEYSISISVFVLLRSKKHFYCKMVNGKDQKALSKTDFEMVIEIFCAQRGRVWKLGR